MSNAPPPPPQQHTAGEHPTSVVGMSANTAHKMSDRWGSVKAAWKRDATLYLTFSAVSFAFGELLFGIDTGSFGSIQALPAFVGEFAPLNAAGKHAFRTETKSIMNSIVWPSKFIGCMILEPLAEFLGYKVTMYFVAVMQIIALIVQLTAKTWQTFSGGRIIAYFAVGIVECAVSAYLAEISPSSLRGFFTGIMNIIVALGNLWGAGMGRAYATETRAVGWMVPVGVQLIPAVAMLILVPFCPESPRWLLLKGKKAQAQKNLDRLRPQVDVDSGMTTLEIDALEIAIQERGTIDQGRWKDLLSRRYFRRVIIGVLLFYGNQCCGNQFINLYGPTFFTSIGLGAKSFTYNTAITGVAIFASIVAVCIVDLTGRRPLLLIGVAWAAIWSAVVGGIGTMSHFDQADTNALVASFCFVLIGNKISVNPLSFLIAAEIGGVRMRKKILAISLCADVVFAFAMSYSVPYLITALSSKVGFVFMGFCLLFLILGYLLVPELTGRSLEEVDELFDRGLWGWQFKNAVTTGIGRRIAEIEEGRIDGKQEVHEAEQLERPVDERKL